MEIRPVGAELFHTEARQVGRQAETDRQTDSEADRQRSRYDEANSHFPKFATALETSSYFLNYYLNKFCVLIRNHRKTMEYE